jgi:hypothetical protein
MRAVAVLDAFGIDTVGVGSARMSGTSPDMTIVGHIPFPGRP